MPDSLCLPCCTSAQSSIPATDKARAQTSAPLMYCWAPCRTVNPRLRDNPPAIRHSYTERAKGTSQSFGDAFSGNTQDQANSTEGTIIPKRHYPGRAGDG